MALSANISPSENSIRGPWRWLKSIRAMPRMRGVGWVVELKRVDSGRALRE